MLFRSNGAGLDNCTKDKMMWEWVDGRYATMQACPSLTAVKLRNNRNEYLLDKSQFKGNAMNTLSRHFNMGINARPLRFALHRLAAGIAVLALS